VVSSISHRLQSSEDSRTTEKWRESTNILFSSFFAFFFPLLFSLGNKPRGASPRRNYEDGISTVGFAKKKDIVESLIPT